MNDENVVVVGEEIEIQMGESWYRAKVTARWADGRGFEYHGQGFSGSRFDDSGNYRRAGRTLLERAMDADRAKRRRTSLPPQEDVAMGELACAWFQGRIGTTAVAATIGCAKGQVPRRMAWALKAAVRAAGLRIIRDGDAYRGPRVGETIQWLAVSAAAPDDRKWVEGTVTEVQEAAFVLGTYGARLSLKDHGVSWRWPGL